MPLLWTSRATSDMTRPWWLRASSLQAYKVSAEIRIRSVWPVAVETDGTPSKRPPKTVLASSSEKVSVLAKLARQLARGVLAEGEGSRNLLKVRACWSHCLLLLLVLAQISSPVSGKPFYYMNRSQIYFRSRICQPVQAAELQKRMGAYFDSSRMFSTAESHLKKRPGWASDVAGYGGYQGDEPGYEVVENGDFDVKDPEITWESRREENMYSSNKMMDDIDGAQFLNRRTLLPDGRDLGRRISKKVRKIARDRRTRNDLRDDENDIGLSDKNRQQDSRDSFSYMKRRRRRSVNDLADQYPPLPSYPDADLTSTEDTPDENVNIEEYEGDEVESELDSKDKKSADSIQLRLFLRGKDRKTRKQLKKKLRQNAKSRPPPWECKLQPINTQLKQGFFPDIVLDGTCQADMCFYRLYHCDPIKYAIKLLYRDPDQCNPLPSLTNVTMYEERWTLQSFAITVGCSCTRPVVKNAKSKPRRRD